MLWGGFDECAPSKYRSLLQKSPIKETIICTKEPNHFKEPANSSHPIQIPKKKMVSKSPSRILLSKNLKGTTIDH